MERCKVIKKIYILVYNKCVVGGQANVFIFNPSCLHMFSKLNSAVGL